jgi:polar amino acid transport system substrate-binding protein
MFKLRPAAFWLASLSNLADAFFSKYGDIRSKLSNPTNCKAALTRVAQNRMPSTTAVRPAPAAPGNRINKADLGRLLTPLFIGIIFFPQSISLGLAAEQSEDSNTVVLSAIVNEQTHAIAKQVLQEVYRRIGYRVYFDDLPGQRALEWANNGLTDGDVARIAGTGKKFPNLIRIKIPILFFSAAAFTKTLNRPISRWEDLRGLSIGVIRGIRYSTIGTKGMDPYFANDMTHLFTILDKGRIQVAVAVLDAGRIEIRKNFAGSGIHVVGTPLLTAPLYHFVNIRHKDLVGKLEAVLSAMTASGEIEKLRRRALDQVLAQ